MKKILTVIFSVALMVSSVIPTFAASHEMLEAKSISVSVDVNGENTNVSAFSVNDEVFVSLRSVAFALSDTKKQFDVQWDNSNKSVNLLSHKSYTVTGGEPSIYRMDESYTSNVSPVFMDGRRVDLPMFTINDTNYVELTELSSLFDLHIAGNPSRYSIDTEVVHEEVIDYSLPAHWARFEEDPNKPVDIFFIYPTAWVSPDRENQKTAEIDDSVMIVGSQNYLYRTIGIFEEGNVYAPYYRQFDAGVAFSLSPEEQNKLSQQVSEDVEDAFDYYINNINTSRPFVLAGHSQGSLMMTYLLSDYMKDHPEVQERMVAAYAVGISVTESYMEHNPHLKFAEGATDTGAIISWNTQADPVDVPDLINPLLMPGALVINPINWKRDGTVATASENLGSHLMNADGSYSKVMNYADARVDSKLGALISKSIIPEDHHPWALFPLGCYHPNDYDFYYYSVQQNVKDRIDAYMNKSFQLSN